MSVRRAEDAGVSPWWVVAFFMPGLNYLLMAVLAALPSVGIHQEARPALPGRSPRSAVLLGAIAGDDCGVLLTFGGLLFRTYGLALFVGASSSAPTSGRARTSSERNTAASWRVKSRTCA